MGSWPVKWKFQNVLVAIWRGAAPPVVGMGSRTWGLFRKLRIPVWDYDFVRRALWRKLAVATRLVSMTRCCTCAFDGKEETDAHVFGECRFGQFVHEAVRHTFGPPLGPTRLLIDLSCNFLQKQEVALTTAQGILTWSGMSVAWSQRCQAVLGKQTVSLHTMVAQWVSKLEFWRQSTTPSVHRPSISPLLSNLRSWIDTGSLGAYWHVPKGPRYLLSLTDAQRTSLKSKKFSGHISKVLKEVDELQRGGWTVVFTDGSSKRVGGWDQAGYGCFDGDRHPGNVSAHVPEGETQSNNRGEVRAVLCALEAKLDSQKMTIVVDSEYIYDALTKYILKWGKAGWRSSSGAVSHSNLWIPVSAQMRHHQQTARFIWVPSHIGIVGDEGADRLAEQGRQSHPYNLICFAKRPAFDDGLTRHETDLPSQCSWVLSEPEEAVEGEGGSRVYKQ